MKVKDSLMEMIKEHSINLEDACFNLITTVDTWYVCFYVSETTDFLIIVTTTEEGNEELLMVNKEMIVDLKLNYLTLSDKAEEKNMYV